jgi:hypothetical protein
MEMQEIEVNIGKDGQVEIIVRGVKGPQCLDLTASLEEILGGVVISREMTPEANEVSPVQIDQTDQSKTGK